MEKYDLEIINNHLIVKIGNDKYLIDTGSPDSFMMSTYPGSVIINGESKKLRAKNFDDKAAEECFNLVGKRFIGFIGLDIIRETSLTIFLNEKKVAFGVDNVSGETIPFLMSGYPIIESSLGHYYIDTGAMYPYGVKRLFTDLITNKKVHDFNPFLDHLNSEMYGLNITIGRRSRNIGVCENSKVETNVLNPLGCSVIGNIIDYIDDTCVFDMKRQILIIK